MSQTLEFVKDRATKTIAAAKAVAAQWTWQEKTVAQMNAAVVAIVGDNTVTPVLPGQEKITSAAEQEMVNARSAWDAKLDTLHKLTMQGVSMAKNRYRNDPIKLSLVADLSARGDSRAAILEEALNWETAWSKAEPGWSPLATNTLAAFSPLRLLCAEPLQQDYKDKLSAWREQAGILNQMAHALEDVNEAWYSDALDVFPAGTAEGDMIRGTIPPTYTPPPDKPAVTPPPPTPHP